MKEYQEIERSIITKFRKDIWRMFVKGVQDYQLIKENDNIMVCISGGKDSFLMAKCMQELAIHGDFPFTNHFVVMDPGYSKENIKVIKDNAKRLNIPIEIFKSNIFDSVKDIEKSPCYVCARMRRGHLYNKAKELGCNKIALGHHFDDVIETTLLSMLYSAEIKTMMPKLFSEHYEGLELIRPMYLIKEKAILAWAKYNNLNFINCACKFTEENQIKPSSKRKEIKELIAYLRTINPDIDYNIFKSMDNVNLNCILGTIDKEKHYSFLEDYDK